MKGLFLYVEDDDVKSYFAQCPHCSWFVRIENKSIREILKGKECPLKRMFAEHYYGRCINHVS